MTWDKFDELFASFARPYSMYLCSTSIAFAAVWSVVTAQSDVVIGITIGASAALAGGQSYLRTADKKTAAAAGSPPSEPPKPNG